MKSRRHRSPRTGGSKCVQVVGQGIPVRLTNMSAHQLVAVDHDGEYCPKRVFKLYRTQHPEYPVRINYIMEAS